MSEKRVGADQDKEQKRHDKKSFVMEKVDFFLSSFSKGKAGLECFFPEHNPSPAKESPLITTRMEAESEQVPGKNQ